MIKHLSTKHILAAVVGLGLELAAGSSFAAGEGCARQTSAGVNDSGAPAKSAAKTTTADKRS
jgi:hypothetical protein